MNQALLQEIEFVDGLMSQPVSFLSGETSVLEALNTARERRIHHLPVGDAKAPLGVLCTCDLREAPLSEKLGNLLSRPYVSIECRATIREAAELMREHVVGSLLVTDGDGVTGIITRADLARSANGRSHLAEVVCTCCGSDAHLGKDQYEQLLCVDCRERATEPDSFEQGLGG